MGVIRTLSNNEAGTFNAAKLILYIMIQWNWRIPIRLLLI